MLPIPTPIVIALQIPGNWAATFHWFAEPSARRTHG